MGKRIGIVICNYNKREYVLKCLESLRRQTVQEFDVLVADNASTDGSAEAVEEQQGDFARVFRTGANLGGTGGFNAGLRSLLKEDYEYFLLLDNDVILGEDCVGEMLAAMDGHPELGIQGAKILQLDAPDCIQEFGPVLDTEGVNFILRYRGESDSLPLPGLLSCDYVPACVLMVRREVIDRIGLMPEENFLYYDDIEWCVRCKKAGWEVAANSCAKAWHKGGARGNPTTSSVYYINRNKTAFFLRYFPEAPFGSREEAEQAIRHRAERIVLDMFEGCYSCWLQGQRNVLAARMDAFLDALSGRTGKAGEWSIRPHENAFMRRFEETFREAGRVALLMDGDVQNTRQVVNALRVVAAGRGKPMEIVLADGTGSASELLGIPVMDALPESLEDYDKVLHVCRHIYELGIDGFHGECYVDGWKNLLLGEEDYRRLEEFRAAYAFFRCGYEERVIHLIQEAMGGRECECSL